MSRGSGNRTRGVGGIQDYHSEEPKATKDPVRSQLNIDVKHRISPSSPRLRMTHCRFVPRDGFFYPLNPLHPLSPKKNINTPSRRGVSGRGEYEGSRCRSWVGDNGCVYPLTHGYDLGIFGKMSGPVIATSAVEDEYEAEYGRDEVAHSHEKVEAYIVVGDEESHV
ncbi:MAG: hypothetical protein UU46_C0033G0004 [Candidatus Uhrbacteria bacterium GW2011_GWD1_41_16]|uniref:Uncharacterized protein n=1 Tax=Candidatus Uhrbacteria bacterium GW2011_GWC1_41_20 TaxID=1618983 RepID=A0A0G0YCZ6_9BACT|nr:MAG: hypothetical protein UT52_C0026G0009 [Candidatus Uhrbacteria bacterium GW2011_GWE1_39_46]KKR63140.1 MAG: hypothetical protein UU04_C0025G0009 [Candidatus Uhrbacteria bacterium GW2011_GWC2_40_450]KKR94446.1 MAG: hypothetical protein UU46_C0033G0004 [Candidatus Uhrbacteria bacterium GW2011_GWD1_41_16]KKR98192.1 MAG: hypothetical protein UU50_C0020G0010 [Candidatus Uhrbacteria bacterium GW2011_GWC1_41_20]KKS10868.1 MAG: hypothetical protein UU63_C0027G0009 [Candidatus Uhrbacteria bacterium